MTAFAVFAFVIFPILVFVYFRCTQKYVNPYKLIFIFGKKGSGKSTLLTKYALDYLKRGWNVYSTENCPGTYLSLIHIFIQSSIPLIAIPHRDSTGQTNRAVIHVKPVALSLIHILSSEIILASPAVAAASAVVGVIADPETVMGGTQA